MKKSIRMLAMLLVLTLAFSLFPTSALAADAESTEQPKEFKLSFERTNVNYTGTGTLTNSTKFNKDNYNTVGSKSTQTKWRLGSTDEGSTILNVTNGRVQFLTNYLRIGPTSGEISSGKNTLVIKFEVENPGYYDVSFKPYGLSDGGTGEVSIDSEDAYSKDFYGDGALDTVVLYNRMYFSKGEHEIILKATKKKDGESYCYVAVQSFTFTPSGQLDSAKLEYDKRYVLLSETEGVKLNLSASYTGGKAVDIEKDATVTYESSDEAIATVTNEGVVTPVNTGEVTITATVQVGDIKKDATLPLIISAEPITGFEIDFTAVNRDKLDDSEGRVNKNGTAEGPNWKFNTNRNTSTIFGANKRVRFYDSYLQLFFYSGDITNERNKLVMTFDVPATSLYDIEIFGGVVTSGGIGEFYIDNKYVDEYDFYSEVNNAQGAYDKLRQIYLTEGTHTLTIVARRSSTTSAYVLLSKIKFTECEEISPIVEVGAETERNSIAVGETEPYLIYAVQENGVKFYSKPPLKGTSDVDLKLESEDTNIATVDGDLIRAVSPGDAEMKISGTVAGETAPDGEFKINVNENVYHHAEIDVVHDIFYEGGETEISAAAYLTDGSKINDRDITYYFTSSDENIAAIDGKNKLQTKKEGTATITAHVTFNNQELTDSETIKVIPVNLEKIEAHTEDNIVSAADADGSQIIVKGTNNDGSEADISSATFTFENLSPDLIEVTEDGKVFSIARGGAQVKVKMTLGGVESECIADVISSSQKTEPTLYTYTMRKNALDNIKKYDWAKSSKETAVKDAEYWLANYEKVYDTIMYEGIPRAYSIGLHDSPDDFDYKCAYCQEDVRNHASAYGWKTDPLNRPWKIQCPACKRLFPSNDFGRFYELGLDQKRQFDRTRALEAHRTMLLENGEVLPDIEISEERMAAITKGLALTKEERAYYGYGNSKGYLYNNTLRDAVDNNVMLLDNVYNENGNITKEGVYLTDEDLNTYAVDDGMGWDTGLKADSGIPLMKTFIPFYHHAMYSINGKVYLTIGLPALMNAYLYTGDIKYGRAGAILIDRIADVFPSFDLTKWVEYQNSHGGRNTGKILGAIWETGLAETFVKAYDAFYPAMDDPEVIRFLSEKAAKFRLENPKLTGDMIRENCENGIVRETFKGAKEDKIQGNFGMHQLTVTCAAVALDTFPETQEMIDWLMARTHKPAEQVSNYGVYKEVDGELKYIPRTFSVRTANAGGEIGIYLVNEVDRDGFGYEIGASYNQSWLTNIADVAEVIRRYGKYKELDLYSHPKYKKMFNSIYQMTMAGGYTLHLGDYDRTATTKNTTSKVALLRAFKRIGDPLYARILYDVTGGNISDQYIDIFEPDAEGPQKEIEDVIEEQGEYKLGSRNLPGFGLAVLSGGELVKNSGAIANADFRRDTWLWYGNSVKSHGHEDLLQMGINAYGFNFTPDLGYPKETGDDPNRLQWVSATISHNTVVVDGQTQKTAEYCLPYHYDGDGMVKLIDVDAAHVYDATDIYRRTLVSVDASDEVAYTVDFFRILGGNDHTYSFHTQSADGYTVVDGLNLVPQKDGTGKYIGSYAGADVPYGEDPGGNPPNNTYPTGYTWLKNVNRDNAPASGNFTVNFKQTDFRKSLKDSKGLNLKFTALNDWTPSSVGIAAGLPPLREDNLAIPHFDYMMIHRKAEEGKTLDTLFTSVIQPYKGDEYIESMKSVPLTCKGTEGELDASRAVKVKLKSGRTDYIIYATNNELTYTLTDDDVSFDFNGFVGVYSVNENGKNIYSYVNDGTKIGDLSAKSRDTGKVKSFTEDLISENEIVVTLDHALSDDEISALAGEYVYIESDKVDNASYRIESASKVENVAPEDVGKVIALDIGDVSLVRSYKSVTDFDAGYNYNISADRKLYIPLSAEMENKPTVTTPNDLTTSAGSSIIVQIEAESADGESLTYIGTVLPRGASINSETGKITWKPDSSQVGESGFFITVRDKSGRESTTSFEVTVYGSTTGSGNKTEDNSGTTTDTPAGGGGGGGGGAAPENPGTSDKTDTDKTEGGEKSPEASGETDIIRFTDLGNYAWAADAINSLADDGIIRGTTSDTYSPGHNITRADFASLLVRAFDLKSDNTENFADVSASDYFASELAIARNNGIISGIGDNKFAPRNTITRQDMMVIVYRALTALNEPPLPKGRGTVEDGGGISPSQYSDFTTVADYAKEAVSALISAGLVNGKSGRIAPTDYTTRAEVAVLIKRILDYVKK